MSFTNLNFFTVTLFLILFLGFIFLFFFKYKKQENINFLLFKKDKKYFINLGFLFLSFFILFFSIFGLKILEKVEEKNKGIDIIFVLDVSKSMNVGDISDDYYNYTRLSFAKKAISDFVIKNKENRFGLVIFSGDAVSLVPLTKDQNIFLTMLKNVDYRNLVKQGSDFSKAINLGNQRLSYSKGKKSALIFLSDGADSDYDFLEKSIEKKENISYFIVGIGTEKGGKIIVGRDPFGNISFQKYRGNYVISKLNEKNLKKLSVSLDGKYLKLDNYGKINDFSYDLDKLEKSIFLDNFNVKKDFSRNLAFISFFFFTLFIIFETKGLGKNL